MKLPVRDLLGIPWIHVHKPEMLNRLAITGISTDSRTIRQGDIFLAIRGEKYDGHEFVGSAHKQGAVCAIVDRRYDYTSSKIPLLVVENTVRALGQLANHYRRKFNIPVIAITGSSGKTTTKEMVKNVLATRYSVLGTEGNRNNHVGVPLTLFRLRRNHKIAVIEMGMNHEHEIANLCAIAQPTHGLITNIGKAHLGFFHSLDDIAHAKGELFDWLANDSSRLGFVNADDLLVRGLARKLKRKMTYGLNARQAHVRGTILNIDERGRPEFSFSQVHSKRRVVVQSRTAGIQNAYNGLAAATVGLHFGIPGRTIKMAIEKSRPIQNRMQIFAVAGVTILNDSYNANPDSVELALNTLHSMKCRGKRVVILGDMLELGDHSQKEHETVGRLINRLGFGHLLTFGPMARLVTEKARCAINVHFDRKTALSNYAARLVSPGDIVLVKGSRGMNMENVVAFLQEQLGRNAS